MIKNNTSTYGSVSKIIHWAMAILFLMMFIIAYTMTNISPSETRANLYDVHKATGLLLFAILSVRFFWRLINQNPKLPNSLPNGQKFLAKWNIIGLYAVMFIMPITGFLTSTLGGHDVSFYWIFKISAFTQNKPVSEFFALAHKILSYIMIFLVSVHLLAALHHYYFRKDNVLQRMFPG
jgi:cytochrome b561